MAQALVNKTLNGSLVDCRIAQHTMFGGMITRTRRTTYTTPFHPWQNYKARTSTEYGFNFTLPQSLIYLFRMDTQHAAMVLFLTALALA